MASALMFPFGATARESGRPVIIIVPYTAGNNTPDILARMIGPELQERLGEPIVIENKPGASGNIGTLDVARAKADGHTLLMAATSFVQNVSLFKNLSYDPQKNFAPIIKAIQTPIGLAINPSLPVTTTREFIDYVKARPGQLNFGSPGLGTVHHLSMELFKLAAGIDIKHIPYRGTAPAVKDLISGQINAMFLPLPVALPLARARKIKLLAVAEKERSAVAPEVPTLAEGGVSGVQVSVWNGLLAPAGTPPALVEKYNKEVNEILRSPAITVKLKLQGLSVVGGTPVSFGEFIKSELVKWRQVVKAADIQAQ